MSNSRGLVSGRVVGIGVSGIFRREKGNVGSLSVLASNELNAGSRVMGLAHRRTSLSFSLIRRSSERSVSV